MARDASARAPREGEASQAPMPLALTVSRERQIAIVVGVMLGMLLASLDQTIVGTAMPRVIADLGGLQHYAWVATGYMLASTVMVPIWGKLSDLYGRRPFFLLGMLLFLLGSALSGTSLDMTQLVLYRGVQGLGAGAMMPLSMAIIGDVFPPAERGKWQGWTMAVFGLSAIVGPTTGGWITDSWGWRWVFYVNMPVGALAIATVGLALPGIQARRNAQIDVLGALTLVAGTVPLLLALSWGGSEYAWVSPQILWLLIVAVVMTGVFIRLEFRASEPIISPGLFRNSVFTVSVIASFLVSAGLFGAIMFLPLFVQAVLGETAAGSGVVLTPMMLGFIASSIVGGQLMSRTGRYKILGLGALLVAVAGMFLLSRMDANVSTGIVARNMVMTGLGIGVMMSLFTIVVQNAFPARQLGEVTASLQFFRSVGGTIGLATFGTVMTNRFQTALQANLPDTLRQAMPPEQLGALANPQVLLAPQATLQVQQSLAALGPQGPALFASLLSAIRISLTDALTALFGVGAAAMLLAFVVMLFLKEIPLRTVHHVESMGEVLEDELAEAGSARDRRGNVVAAPLSTTSPGGQGP